MQDKVLSLIIQARNLMLPSVGYLKQYVFLFLAKFYWNLLKTKNFKNCHFTKYFIMLEAVVCLCLCSERRKVNWNYFDFPKLSFRIKRKRKDAMSVSSGNSVNSAIMYNMKIMIKMSFVIALISRAIML